MFVEEQDEANGAGRLEINTSSHVAGGLPGCVFSKVRPPNWQGFPEKSPPPQRAVSHKSFWFARSRVGSIIPFGFTLQTHPPPKKKPAFAKKTPGGGET